MGMRMARAVAVMMIVIVRMGVGHGKTLYYYMGGVQRRALVQITVFADETGEWRIANRERLARPSYSLFAIRYSLFATRHSPFAD